MLKQWGTSSGQGYIINLCLSSRIEEIEDACHQVEKFLIDVGITDEDIHFSFRLGVHEAVSNAIRHGNQEKEDKNVFISLGVYKGKIVLTVEDEGGGFHPQSPPINNHWNQLTMYEGGRGLTLLFAVMDEVYFNEKGNTIVLTKYSSKAMVGGDKDDNNGSGEDPNR